MELRYGMNPDQRATIESLTPGREPLRIVHGQPSFINVLDILNAWQLVRDASAALDAPAAASFKHVSPAGAAIAGTVDDVAAGTYGVDPDSVGAVTSAYLRARDADPQSSYGDVIAVSHPVDAELADLLSRLVSDAIIAPGYEPGTVGLLQRKKHGNFLVAEGDVNYVPPREEVRDVYGLRLTQRRSEVVLDRAWLPSPVTGEVMPERARDDLLLGLIVLRYTQSNSVAYLRDGATLGIGAGQQSRIGCTRLAGAKVDTWWLRRHPDSRGVGFDRRRIHDRIAAQFEEVPHARREWLDQLDGVSFVSDGAIPFRDNIDEAARHGVRFIAEPGGSSRTGEIREACGHHGISLTETGIRLFQH